MAVWSLPERIPIEADLPLVIGINVSANEFVDFLATCPRELRHAVLRPDDSVVVVEMASPEHECPANFIEGDIIFELASLGVPRDQILRQRGAPLLHNVGTRPGAISNGSLGPPYSAADQIGLAQIGGCLSTVVFETSKSQPRADIKNKARDYMKMALNPQIVVASHVNADNATVDVDVYDRNVSLVEPSIPNVKAGPDDPAGTKFVVLPVASLYYGFAIPHALRDTTEIRIDLRPAVEQLVKDRATRTAMAELQ